MKRWISVPARMRCNDIHEHMLTIMKRFVWIHTASTQKANELSMRSGRSGHTEALFTGICETCNVVPYFYGNFAAQGGLHRPGPHHGLSKLAGDVCEPMLLYLRICIAS